MNAIMLVQILLAVTGSLLAEILSPPSPCSSDNNNLASVLLAEAPSEELGAAAEVYASLIGSWDVRAADYQADGARQERVGEWHFGWVLEGRAVQDVWVCPTRAQRKPALSKAGNRYGTSLRVYDASIDAWRVTWINPVSGAHDELIGRRKGKEILQEGRDSEGKPIRWVFTDITPTSFRWYGERSRDKGVTWRLEAEFFAKRKQ